MKISKITLIFFIWIKLHLGAQVSWETVYPTPEPGEWSATAYGNGTWVVAGDGKILSTTDEGSTWSIYKFGTNDYFDDVIWTGNRFVAVGQGTDQASQWGVLIAESTDGMNWTVRDRSEFNVTGQAEKQRLNSIAANADGSVLVAGGFQGTLFRSTDGGDTWSGNIYIPDPDGHVNFGLIINSVAYGNGKFVFIQHGNTGLVISVSSDDGATWITTDVETTNSAESVAYGGGNFVISCVGDASTLSTHVLISADGVNWTRHEVASGSVGTFYNMAYSNGTWVASPSYPSVPFASTDNGVTWTQQTPAITNGYWKAVGAGNGTFLMVGSGSVQTSPNGLNWTALVGANSVRLYGASYTNGSWFATGEKGTILRSDDDGASWASVSPQSTSQVNSVLYNNGQYVAVGGKSWTSSDGASWTEHSLGGLFPVLNDFVYGNGLYVAVGKNGQFRTSSDGQNWTTATVPTPANVEYKAVAFGGGQFIAAGQSFSGGYLVSSPDGSTWTQVELAELRKLDGIEYGNGRFVAAGDGYYFGETRIYASTDGITWTETTQSTDLKTDGRLVFNGSKFVILGTKTFTSADGLTWTEEATESFQYIDAVGYGNGVYLGVGQKSFIQRATASVGMTNSRWPEAEDFGSGWWKLDWFNFFWEPTPGSNWIFHQHLGWLYVKDSGSALWLYSMDFGWVYTSETRFPYLYSKSQSSWLFYQRWSAGPRWFYDYSTKDWINL